MKRINLWDFFDEEDFNRAFKLRWEHNAIERIEEELVLPKMKLIDERTGQENDSKYLAYALQYGARKLKEQDGI